MNLTRFSLEGWGPPFPEKMDIREVTTANDLSGFKRIHSYEDVPQGRFIVRAKDIEDLGNDAEKLRLYLGLREKPAYISDVTVPANVRLQVGPIAEQPNFGLFTRSGFQYRFAEQPNRAWFFNTEPLK